jgi:hypothetical protein
MYRISSSSPAFMYMEFIILFDKELLNFLRPAIFDPWPIRRIYICLLLSYIESCHIKLIRLDLGVSTPMIGGLLITKKHWESKIQKVPKQY